MEIPCGVFYHAKSASFYLIPSNVDLASGRFELADLKDHPILVKKKEVEKYNKTREEIMEYLKESTEAHVRASRAGISDMFAFSKKFSPSEEESKFQYEEQKKTLESLIYSLLGVSKETVENNAVAAQSGMEKIQHGFEEFMQKAQLEVDESESAKELMAILNTTFDTFEKKVTKGLEQISERIENFLNDEKTEQAFKDFSSKWTNQYTDEERKQEIKSKIEQFANQFLNTGKGNDAPTDEQ